MVLNSTRFVVHKTYLKMHLTLDKELKRFTKHFFLFEGQVIVGRLL